MVALTLCEAVRSPFDIIRGARVWVAARVCGERAASGPAPVGSY